MQLTTSLGEIPVLIRRGRGKRLKMSFTAEKHLLIETPTGQHSPEIDIFLQKNLAWVEKTYPKLVIKQDEKTEFLANLATHIPYLGKPLPIRYHEDKQTKFKVSSTEGIDIYCPENSVVGLKQALIRMAMERLAEHYLKQKVAHWAKITQSKVNNVAVKAQKTRWGSCSSKANINLNWHVVLLAEKYIDYLIIHELMHLREMNHSERFWQNVAMYCPDYQKIDKELNQFTWMVNILK